MEGNTVSDITLTAIQAYIRCLVRIARRFLISPIEILIKIIYDKLAAKLQGILTEVINMRYKAAVLTASDKGFSGNREDLSGEELERLLKASGFTVIKKIIVPDEKEVISNTLIELSDNYHAELILTTGGTGFSPRDITPEATKAVIDREVPGIPEAMRQKSLEITNRAMLSRAAAGIRKKTLIINMPGSPKAVKECFDVIIPILPHALEILSGKGGECAR